MPEIRVALAGAGNCASSLMQGLCFYADAADDNVVPGLMNVRLGGYHVRDIALVAAFDIAAGKVGLDLSRALAAYPNNTRVFAELPPSGLTVQRGPTLDGLGPSLAKVVTESSAPAIDVAQTLRAARADILVSYLPVGSDAATRCYAQAALDAGCAFINCIPSFVASDPDWAGRFEYARLPVIGDDIKSQVGATIVHRALATLFRERGVRIDRTYQLNVGGNADFMNMLDRDRLVSKKLSKTRAVTSQLATELPDGDVHVGPSDHVPWLTDRKLAYIRVEGTGFGDSPISCELKLEVWDSPNSAGVVIDAIRCARLALDRGIGGPLAGPCAWFMKSPPAQMSDHDAHHSTRRFIEAQD